jgi:2-C-methyl-D-erythritol 4-phosphate cytidylyltransferase
MHVSAILPAAGLGTRMGLPHPEKDRSSRKQFIELDGLPILIHTIKKFASSPAITDIFVALRPDDITWVQQLVDDQKLEKSIYLLSGGETRQESVMNAISALPATTELIAVHDAVRPLIELDLIAKVVEAAAKTGAAIIGIVPVDTVKQMHLHRVQSTIPRERLILAQTPQVFRADLLRKAMSRAQNDGFIGTDESSLVERLEAVEVTVIPGSDRNLKITRATDLALAKHFLSEESDG